MIAQAFNREKIRSIRMPTSHIFKPATLALITSLNET